jgi:hypothetical protein
VITTSPVPDFITAAELKTHLNKTSTADDAELAGFVSAACQMIVDRIGQVSPVDAQDIVDVCGLRRTIVLQERPATAVTSVMLADGTAVPAADLENHVAGWVFTPGAGLLRHTGYWPRQQVTVTYTAGRDPLPGNIRLAALELAGHLWKQSQLNSGGRRPPVIGDDQVIIPGAAYALPIRVRELLGLGKNPTSQILVG